MGKLLFYHQLQVLKLSLPDYAPRLVSPGHQCVLVVLLSQQNFGEPPFAENVNQHAGGSQARQAWVLLTIFDASLPFCFLRTDSA